MNKIIEIIIDILNKDQIGTLMILTILFLATWLYKEFRKNSIDLDNSNLKRIDTALEVYGELQVEIVNYLNNKCEKIYLLRTLSKAYPLIPKNILDIILKWQKEDDDEQIKELLNKLNDEIIYLKSLQYNPVTYRSKNSIISRIEYYLVSNRWGTFFTPLVSTFIIIVLILLMMLFIIAYSQGSIKQKISIVFNGFNISLHIFVCVTVIEFICKHKFNNKIEVLSLYAIFLFVSGTLLFSTIWCISPLNTILIISYLVLIIKKYTIKNNKLN